MAANTVAFTLTSEAYQDVSEGHDTCSLRLPYIAQKNNVIRVYLGNIPPSLTTGDYDEFMAPQSIAEEWQLHFHSLGASRVYVLAVRDQVRLRVYRK